MRGSILHSPWLTSEPESDVIFLVCGCCFVKSHKILTWIEMVSAFGAISIWVHAAISSSPMSPISPMSIPDTKYREGTFIVCQLDLFLITSTCHFISQELAIWLTWLD